MSKKQITIILLIIIVFSIFLLISSFKEREVNPPTREIVLVHQEGLPSPVELKRQAIYKAVRNKDFEALSAEVDPSLKYSFGEHKDYGFKEYINECNQNDCNELYRTIETILTLPYGTQSGIYFWPEVFGKSSNKWTEEDINQMKVLLSDQEIESYRMFGGYAYYRLGIDKDGKWIYYISGD